MKKYELFKEVVLLRDIPEKKLRKGDVATIIEYHPVDDSVDGYTLEVFNVLGDTISIITVSENDIESLREDEIFNARTLENV